MKRPFLEERSMCKKNIKIGGKSYSPEELGLERIVVDGHIYVDVTPFWIDSGQAQHIKELIASGRPDTADCDRKGADET